jgi:hypothetical protein
MKFAGWYAAAVGILMLVQWGFFLGAGQVPELQTEPLRIAFHLAGEGATAIALIISGIGLLRSQRWARSAVLVALGMLVYTVIVSPGYFAQQGQWAFVGMFGALLILTGTSIYLVVQRSKR